MPSSAWATTSSGALISSFIPPPSTRRGERTRRRHAARVAGCRAALPQYERQVGSSTPSEMSSEAEGYFAATCGLNAMRAVSGLMPSAPNTTR